MKHIFDYQNQLVRVLGKLTHQHEDKGDMGSKCLNG